LSRVLHEDAEGQRAHSRLYRHDAAGCFFRRVHDGGIPAVPLSFLLTFLLSPVAITYGMGVLLVREVTLRWDKGWASTLLMGGAFGLVLQGLFTKVIFGAPSYAVVGYLGSYGHWLGVNWILATTAFFFEAVFAVAFPIFLTGEWFPRTRGRRLLSERDLGLVLVALSLVVGWEYVYINLDPDIFPSQAFVSSPSAPDVALLLTAVVVLSAIARVIPKDLLRPRTTRPVGSPLPMAAVGLAFTLSIIFLGGPGPALVPWPAVLVLIFVGSSLLCLEALRRRIGAMPNLSHRTAVVAGCLLPWAAFDVALEAGGDWGVLPIAAGIFILLAFLWRRGEMEKENIVGGPSGG
jgi:hypothetical protein